MIIGAMMKEKQKEYRHPTIPNLTNLNPSLSSMNLHVF